MCYINNEFSTIPHQFPSGVGAEGRVLLPVLCVYFGRGGVVFHIVLFSQYIYCPLSRRPQVVLGNHPRVS